MVTTYQKLRVNDLYRDLDVPFLNRQQPESYGEAERLIAELERQIVEASSPIMCDCCVEEATYHFCAAHI